MPSAKETTTEVSATGGGYSREEIHERLDRFLNHPTLRGTLEGLVAAMVDWELRARLKETEHAPT